MRVGIVGAGICGAAVADRLRTALEDDVEIVVLDRAGAVGGRVRSLDVGGAAVEAGASLFHSANALLAGYARELGLHPVPATSPATTVGVWNGSRFVFRSTGSSWRDKLLMLATFRAPLLRAARAAGELVARLDRVYPMLAAGSSWPDPLSLLRAVDLDAAATSGAADYLAERRCTGRLVHDFADPVARNNYGQVAAGLNALVELVSLAGGGLAGGQLLRIHEGNAAVVRGVLERSGAELRLGGAVRRIARGGRGWVLRLADGSTCEVDVAVLAAPPELAGIDVDAELPVPRTYQRIHVTFVAGALRPGWFGRREPPDFVLTTAGYEPFLSLEEIAPGVVKLFSPAELPDALLRELFATVEDRRSVVWDAYPVLAPTGVRPGFTIAPGLYDATALEHFVSTMETQAIAGRAVANLVVADARR